jgi:hypothetical protein
MLVPAFCRPLPTVRSVALAPFDIALPVAFAVLVTASPVLLATFFALFSVFSTGPGWF